MDKEEPKESKATTKTAKDEEEKSPFLTLYLDEGGMISTEEEFDMFFHSVMKKDERTLTHIIFGKRGNGKDVEPYKEMILSKTENKHIHKMHVLRIAGGAIKFVIIIECGTFRQHVLIVN